MIAKIRMHGGTIWMIAIIKSYLISEESQIALFIYDNPQKQLLPAAHREAYPSGARIPAPGGAQLSRRISSGEWPR